MPLPNFLIVGAAKSGTTLLYHYLRQHLQVYMSPQKEAAFFAYEGTPLDFTSPGIATSLRDVAIDIAAYRRLFDGAREERAIGEASPHYMLRSQAVGRIRHHLPRARIVAILRHLAERIFSSFTDDILRQYMEAFGRERVRVYLYENLRDDPAALLADLLYLPGRRSRFPPRRDATLQCLGTAEISPPASSGRGTDAAQSAGPRPPAVVGAQLHPHPHHRPPLGTHSHGGGHAPWVDPQSSATTFCACRTLSAATSVTC